MDRGVQLFATRCPGAKGLPKTQGQGKVELVAASCVLDWK